MENLDREMAELMGWELRKHPCPSDNFYAWCKKGVEDFFLAIIYWQEDWHPSTDIAQAFIVVEKMRDLGWYFWLGDEPSHFPNSESGLKGNWCCEFSGNQAKGEIYEVIAETKEKAICLAAREAVKEGQSSSPNTP